MTPIDLFLIHGDQLLIEAIARSFAKQSFARRPLVRLLGATGELAQALERLPRLAVDVLLIDVDLGRRQALEMTLEIRGRFPELKILPLGLRSEEDALEFLEAGASGYVLRQSTFSDLLEVIVAVHRGQPPCSARLVTRISERIVELSRERIRRQARRGAMTPRQHEILQLVAEGLYNKEIAARLEIALPTVKNHVHQILDKLQARNRRQAVLRAYESGLVENPLPFGVGDERP